MVGEINVKKHVFVPEHSKISSAQKEKLLKDYNITIKEVPKISSEDPTISQLNPKVGDIIKIKRNSVTAGESFYFRVVVE